MISADVAVLCYHRISRWPLPSGTWVQPDQLARQLRALQAAGSTLISPDEYLDLIAAPKAESKPDPDGILRRRPTGSPVLVTFDDGTVDLFHYRDILIDLGVRPVVFIPADFAGRMNSWEWPIPGRRIRHLSHDQLRELAASGWEIGLHGAGHCDLSRLSGDDLAAEISVAREKLQEKLHSPIRFFSYPFGRTTPVVVEAVRQAGISAAFVLAVPSSRRNTADPLQTMRRPVYCIDTVADVLAKVTDPGGETLFGRWQFWKETAAHGVGRWTAGQRKQ